jgi:hypothetical protein
MVDEKVNLDLGGHASDEEVAFKLMDRILNIPDERKDIDSHKILDTYARCLEAVKGRRKVSR